MIIKAVLEGPDLMPADVKAKPSTKYCRQYYGSSKSVFPKGKLCSSKLDSSGPLPWFFFDVFHYIAKNNFFNFYGCEELFGKFKAGVIGLMTETIC